MKKCFYLAFLLFAIKGLAQVNLTANLKVCMPFNGNANDVSGNAFNGTVNNATLTSDRFGNVNSAYQFLPSAGSGISVATFSAIAPTNELTISMWAKSDVTTTNCLFTIEPDSQSDRCVGCAQYVGGSNTQMIWDYGNISTNGRSTYTNVAIDNTNWHHYVFILSQSGNTKQLYCDGVLKINKTYGGSVTNKNKPIMIGGGYTNGNTSLPIKWNGKIDDVCIYNRALNSSEVSALYAGTGACFDVGIQELSSIEQGIVYPTASETGVYNFSMTGMNSESKIEVYSTDGKLIKSFTDLSKLNNTIDISNTNSGVYIVKLFNNGKVFSQKLVRN